MIAKSTDEDDLGLPESPIYSNYARHLWKAHTRHGLVQSPNRSRENTDGPRPMPDERSPAQKSPLAAAGLTKPLQSGER
jgi:hypothetical protein